jgi:predicted dehydrogenase
MGGAVSYLSANRNQNFIAEELQMSKDRVRQGRRVSRRDFIGTAAVAAGAAALAPSISLGRAGRSILGANGSVGIGYIGIGIRGEILMRRTQPIEGTRIVGVADLYDGHFERAKEVVGSGSQLQTTKDYKQLLGNKEINAVVVAVPDHWHRQIALDALAAGKDVYLEKPMTYRWEDGPVIAAAAKKHGRVLQVGSQQQSNPANERAIEMIKSGKLGKVTLINGYMHRNTATGAWYYPIPPDASPQTIDWKRFIGPAPWREFDARRFFQWRLFWDYSGGLPTDLFVHLVTAAHTVMGAKMASRVVATGGIYHWKDREVPDQMTALVEYPEGFTLSLSATANNNHNFPLLTIMGTEGTLEYHGTKLVYHPEPVLENFEYSTNSWPEATKKKYAELNDIDPESMRPNATAKVKRPKPEEIETPGTESTEAHLAKFYDSVRTRKEPVENAEMGSLCATVGHMVNLSYKARKEARWDAAKQRVVV